MTKIDELITRYPALTELKSSLADAVTVLETAVRAGGKILLCGNGGSAADCEHIAGELLKGFLLPRPLSKDELTRLPFRRSLQKGIPAIPLPSLTAALTAFANDADPTLAYAQLVLALGKPGDVLIGISTSGNAQNVLAASQAARAGGLKTIALTGKSGGRLADECDLALCVPEEETFKVQELHLPVYHALCAQLEENLFGEESR